jgi:FkbM family methyltransferase
MTDKEVIWNSLHGVEGDSDKGPEKELVEAIDIDGFTCLDLGFNYGWWSWLFLKHIGKKGKVYAWEPNKFLYENYLAKWPFKNLVGYNYGLSDKTGLQEYYVHGLTGGLSGNNSLEKDSGINEPIEIQKVPTKTLDDWWVENNKPGINFIKIDCEGHDYKILLGGKEMIKSTKPKFIVIEQKDQNVSDFMLERNYVDNHEYSDIGVKDSIWKLQS